MLRQVFRGMSGQGNGIFARKKSDTNKDRFLDRHVAYESEYFYKQDSELLDVLKRKTQEEVTTMQKEIRSMRLKIEDHDRNISENLRFLKGLEKNQPASDKKES